MVIAGSPPRGPSAPRAGGGWTAFGAAVAVGLVASILAVWRLMPGLGFWDTAEFQMVLPVMGTAHPTGYPSYVLVGWLASILLAPVGEAALRMNLLSAILVGIAVAFTVDLGLRLTGSVVLGLAAGLGTAVTPIVWAIGTHADPHALHLAFVAIILWLLVRWEAASRGDRSETGDHGDPVGRVEAGVRGASGDGARAMPGAPALGATGHADRLLLAAAVVVGLAVGNHSLTLFLGPPIILFVLAVDPGVLRRPGFIAANVLAFAIPTVLVRLEMVLRAGWFRAPFVYANPSTWDGFWYVTLGAQFHSWLTDPFGNPGKRLGDLAVIAAGQLGPLAALVLVAAIVTAFRRPRYMVLTGTAMVLTLFFNSVYPDGAIDRYYLGPALIAWTWLAILGRTVVDVLVAPGGLLGPSSRVDLAIGGRSRGEDRLARRLAALVVAALLLTPSALAFSERAALVDRSRDRSAEVWTESVLTAVEPNAVIVSWWSFSTPLWYAQVVDDLRPDICIIDDRTRLDYALGELDQVIDRYLATRPVYLIRNGDSELPALVGRYNVTPVPLAVGGNLLRVTPIRGPLGATDGRIATATTAREPRAGRPSLDVPATREGCP